MYLDSLRHPSSQQEEHCFNLRWATVKALLNILIGVLVIAGVAFAQRTGGSLSGFVQDPSGAQIPGAKVDVQNTETRAIREAITNTTGAFLLPDLEPGNYELTITAPGMQTERRTGINVTTGAVAQVVIEMKIGSASEHVEVSAAAQIVNTQETSVSDLVNSTEMQNLPTDVRSYSALLRTEPGVTPGAISTKETGVNTDTGGFIAGQRAFDSAFTVDGGNAVPVVWPQPLWALVTNGGISPDAVLELRVYTTNKPPDAGGKSGSLEAVTTKSGTATFHGSAFEYFRNTVLDARSFFDPTLHPYNQNQFGGSLGGPLMRGQKAFFFGNFEGFRSVNHQSEAVTVPTPKLLAMIPGGPSYGYLQQIYQYTFPAYIPGTSTNGLVGTGIGTYDTGIDKDMGLARLDYNLPHNNSFTLRYMQVSGSNGYGAVGASGVIGGASNEVWAGNNAIARLTTIISPTMVNEVHMDYDRHNYTFGAAPPPAPLIADGFNPESGTNTSLPSISATSTGLATAGNPTFLPERRHENSFEYADTLSWTKGPHSMAFGVQFLPQQSNMVAASNINRATTFDGFGSGLDAASCTLCLQYGLTTGVFQTQTETLFQPGDNGVKGYRIKTSALFAHDTWHVTKRFTLDYGLRWTYSSPFAEAHGKLNNLYVENSNGQPIAGASVDPASMSNVVLATSTGSLPFTKRQWDAYAPNIGFNWDPFGDGKTAISAGYSIAYERPYMQYMYSVGSNVPYVTLSQVSGYTFGYFAQLGTSAAVSSPALMTYNPNDILPEVQYWNFQVQRSLNDKTILSVAYLGNHGSHMYVTSQPNGGSTYTSYAIHPVRPDPLYGVVSEIDTTAISNYDGLAVELRQRFAKGFSYKLAYTYSKSLDDASAGTALPENMNNFMLDYGPSDFDIRNVVAGNIVYALPFGKDGSFAKCSHGFECAMISGWQVSTIYSFNTGQPFSITSGSDNNQDGDTNDRAFWVPGASISQLYNFGATQKSQYLNPAAKGTILATTGAPDQQTSRNEFRAPSFFDEDTEVRKVTPITEKLKLTFMAQAINMTNHTNFGTPVATLTSGTFGQLQTVLPHGLGRVFQLALRLDF